MEALIKLSADYGKNQLLRKTNERTGSVLISQVSSLVEILPNETATESDFFATVDTENLVRFWSIQDHTTNITFKIPMKKRVTACDIDKKCNLILITL